MLRPVKPHLSVTDQVSRLIARGMTVQDRGEAERALRAIGYYRLSGYWYPFRESTDGQIGSNFRDGTELRDVLKLSGLDQEVRKHLLRAVDSIEVAVRASLGYVLGAQNPIAHRRCETFRDSFHERRDGEPSPHEAWLSKANTRLERSKDAFVLHHRQHYIDVPIWVLTEVLDFGDLSKLHEALPRDLRDQVAKPFRIRDKPSPKQVKGGTAGPGGVLVDWLQTVTLVRNVAAHHGRTYNRRFPAYATSRLREMPIFEHVTQANASQLYGVVCLLDHMVSAIDPANLWRRDLEHDIDLYREELGAALPSLGYPT